MHNVVNEIVIPRDIENIPGICIFNDSLLNNIVEDFCHEVLIQSENIKNAHRYGEIAIAYDIESHNKFTLFGSMHHIELNESINPVAQYFNSIIQEGSYSSVVIVHNHPNNASFSLQDIRLFLENDSIHALLAIGNTENIYIIIDKNIDKASRRRLYIDIIKFRAELIKNKLADSQLKEMLYQYISDLFDNPEKLLAHYGFELVHLYREVK